MCCHRQELGEAQVGAVLSAKARKAIYLYIIMHILIHKSQKYLYPCMTV